MLRLELGRLLAQRGTYAGLAILAALVVLFAWGAKVAGPPMMQEMPASGDFVFGGKILNGPAMAYIMLAVPVAVAVLLPMLIATTSGGLIAAEARAGTLRYLLVRPISRLGLLTAKLLAAWVHALGITLFMGAFALGLGYLLFGGGDLLILRGGVTVLPEGTALLRLAQAYLLAGFGMCAVASIALLLSVLCDNPLTAAGVTVAFLLVSAALKVVPYFEWLEPHLLTHHLTVYNAVLVNRVDSGALILPLLHIGAYALLPCVVGAVIFQRRDMTC